MSDEALSGAFSSVNMALNRYTGSIPLILDFNGMVFQEICIDWDAPSNSWPPHRYIILQTLRALPSNMSGAPLFSLTGNNTTFAGQLGIHETDLLGQSTHP
jgi:alpha,alpha-trehalase